MTDELASSGPAREVYAYEFLGKKYLDLNDLQKALEYFQLDLGIAKELGNKTREEYACNLLGVTYGSLGKLDRAIEFYENALRIAENIGDNDSEGKIAYNLGNVYVFLGQYQKAVNFFQEALGNCKAHGDKLTEGKAYNNLGNAYHALGDFANSIEFYQKALSISKHAKDRAAEAKTYWNLGHVYRSRGDIKAAIDCYELAVSAFKEFGDIASEAMAYTSLGNCYKSLGEFMTAVKYYQKALRIAKKVGKKFSEGSAYANLGAAYCSLGDFEKAIDFLQEAVMCARSTGFKVLEGAAYINIGSAYCLLGDFEKAIEFFQQALNIAIDTGDKSTEGGTYHLLGKVHSSTGDYKSAIELLQQALCIAQENGEKYSEGLIYGDLGFAYRFLGDVCKAEDCFKSSVKICDNLRDLMQSKDEWKISFRDLNKRFYSSLIVSQLEQHKTLEALLTADRGRAQALMDLMESQYNVKTTSAIPEMQAETISFISSPTIFVAQIPNSINFWVLKKGKKIEFVTKQVDLNSLQSLAEEVLKEIGVFQSVMCENRSLDDPTDEATEDLPDGKSDESGLKSTASKDNALSALSEVVMRPILHLTDGDEVVIVPDGSLFLIPYSALLDKRSRYLSETLRLRLMPSLSSLQLMAECPLERHSTSEALIVGDPWVKSVRIRGSSRPLKQLPAARKEAETIGEILKTLPLIGEYATKAEVLSRLNSVSLVHIAAHGSARTGEIVLSPNPTQSKRPGEEDFLLTMADVLNAKLQAKLVVLSCCHSGRGKIKAEGVVGIARAFLGAGARSVLASLWAIDDDATLEFMMRFYENLVKGQSASKSLNMAMKSMRESEKFSAVKYWAPFVLIGDDVTLTFE